jgi:Flp pilus assembly protein TadB
MGISFERGLESVSKEGHYCSKEFSEILRHIRAGASVRTAIASSAERVDSLSYKRALSQLAAAYEQGSRGEPLKRIADDLISQQLGREKEMSSKLSLASILFISAACIVPALLLAYLVVGSSFLSFSISPLQVWLLFLVGFPLMDLAIIGYARLSFTPGISASSAPPLFSGRELSLLAREANLEDAAALKRQLAVLLILGLFLSAALFYIFLLPIVFLLVFLPLIYYLYLQHRLSHRNAELEKFLPDALMQAASLEKGTSAERVLDSLAKAGYGPLSEEFRKARNAARAGASFPSALLAIGSRNSSVLLQRAVGLMAAGYSLGSGAYSSLREAAEDMLSVFAIMRERTASASMHKYTLLACGFFVPFILGTLLRAVAQMDVGSFAIGSAGAAANSRTILEAAQGASQFYVALYALLSSLLIAQVEGNWRRFFPYFIILAPLALLVFSIAQQYSLFSLLS